MGKLIRDVIKEAEFDVADSTLRKWLEEGICGDHEELPTVRKKGKKVTVLEHNHLVKLSRFLHFRRLMVLKDRSLKLDLDECLALQTDVNLGNLQLGLDKLTELKELLEDLLGSTNRHYQALFAELHGDPPIDPLDPEFD